LHDLEQFSFQKKQTKEKMGSLTNSLDATGSKMAKTKEKHQNRVTLKPKEVAKPEKFAHVTLCTKKLVIRFLSDFVQRTMVTSMSQSIFKSIPSIKVF
jgi:hypothetical protein